MDPQRWQRARELFDRAADLDEAARAAVLADCDDPLVRDEARALLDAHDRTDDTRTLGARSASLVAQAGDAAQARRVGERFGAWRIVRALGRGGMGEVYLAERADHAYTQQVALKLMQAGVDRDDLLARFRHERQILASLAHPNIARLVDGGAGPGGEPFLALEYVAGEPIDAHADGAQLDIDARLALFVAVGDAIAYAHEHLVVHRDLKPGNVMVATDGTVKLLDFGIAKLIHSDAPAQATATRLRVFTPAYAAPEQVRGEPTTTAVDVYALGVLLHALLTGAGPYGEGLSATALEHAVLTREPARPSDAALRGDDAPARATARRTTPARLRARLRGDLDAIVARALRKSPDERYPSARALVDDVRAHLDRRPVTARRGERRYRVARFVRRHALAVALVTLAVASLVVGLGVAVWQARAAREQQRLAQAEAVKSRAALSFMTSLFALADPGAAQGEKITARELLDRGTSRIRDTLRDQPAARGELLRAMGDAYVGLGLYEEALPLLDEAAATSSGDALRDGEAALSEAIALIALGRFDDALARLAPLRERIDAIATSATTRATREAAALLVARIDDRAAGAQQAMNRFDAADASYRAALDTQRRLLGNAARATHDTAIRYVSLLVLRNRGDDAMALAESVLAAARAATPPDDVFLARALAATAMVATNKGPLDRAEALRREELAINARIYGDAHPTTTGSRNDLAAVLFAQRRVDEADALFARVFDERRAQLGADHPSVATAANNRANTALGRDRLDVAHDAASEALRIRLATYGEAHHTTALSLRTLGLIALQQGDLPAARAFADRAVAAYRAALGPDAPQQAGAVNDLARIALLQHDRDAGCAAASRAQRFAATYAAQAPERRYVEALADACAAASGDAAGAARLRDAVVALRAAWGKDERRVQNLAALADVVAPAR